jgi:3-methyladenine DNA glycosylase AlkD
MKNIGQIRSELKQSSNPSKAKILQSFFKTGPGEYGEGDIFVGVTVPELRRLAQQFPSLSLKQIQCLLYSSIHEERLVALIILINQYKRAPELQKKELYLFYCQNAKHVNNWDLVDISSPHIVGDYLHDKSKSVLIKLAKSDNLWERRIAIVSTLYFIRQQCFGTTLKLAQILLYDKEELIHKAVGWMLREVGKRDQATEELFLNRYYNHMPRTMLRYAIERFPEKKRIAYLKGSV